MLFMSINKRHLLRTTAHSSIHHHHKMLPRSEIDTIKANLLNATSAKNPTAVASAVELPPLPKRAFASTNNRNGGSRTVGSSSVHREHLKIDGVGDWTNVLNPLLDAHAAIRAVSAGGCCDFVERMRN
jgi:hypothetical protein